MEGIKYPLKSLLKELDVEREKLPTFKSFEEYVDYLYRMVENETMVRTISSTTKNYWQNFMGVYEKYGEQMKVMAEEVRKVKEYSIDHLEELIETTCKNIEANKGHCYVAKDKDEANRIIAEIVGDAETIVKSKSMVTEEIGIREYLEDLGKDVYETDLGEFLVQVLGPKPMHFVTPSLHIPRVRVAEFLEKLTGQKVDPDNIPGMVALVRQFLREKFVKADVGISGANVIAADPGHIFIIENEGNARLTTTLPEKHIVVTGIEKIVPTYLDAAKVVDVTMKYNGYRTVSYVNITGGPSKTGDIEKKVTYGAHGPRELHVILLDNGRSEAAKDPAFKEALYCLKCGACMYVCPVFKQVGGYWGGAVYTGGIGVIWTAITRGLKEAYPLSMLCTFNGFCEKQCPMKINQPRIIREIRRRGNKLVGI